MDKLAIQNRFPHFINLFSYDHNGYIININKDFTWNGHDYFTIKKYIIDLVQHSEKANIQKITNVKDFISRILNLNIKRYSL